MIFKASAFAGAFFVKFDLIKQKRNEKDIIDITHLNSGDLDNILQVRDAKR